MREIKFRASFQIEDEGKSFSAIIPNVCVYSNQGLGCSIDDFASAIYSTGWKFDGMDEYFIHRETEELIHFGNANVSVHEDGWVLFDGKPMQFTGLTDRNKKEIYEGDICKLHHIDGGLITECKWQDHWTGYSLIGRETYQRFSPSITYHGINPVEVIGNIYQDSELLEAK